MSDLILLGVVGAPHGVRGEVRIKTFTGDPLGIAGYGPLTDGKGRSFDPRNSCKRCSGQARA
jgi:16S rRNA processing protein RimM